MYMYYRDSRRVPVLIKYYIKFSLCQNGINFFKIVPYIKQSSMLTGQRECIVYWVAQSFPKSQVPGLNLRLTSNGNLFVACQYQVIKYRI